MKAYPSSTAASYPRAEDLARALGGKRVGDGWRARCPAHQGENPNAFAIWQGTDRPMIKCWVGCPPKRIYQVLEARGLWPSRQAKRAEDHSPILYERQKEPKALPPPKPNRSEEARRLWESATPIPRHADHPARRWMQHRGLWRAEVEIPPALRWGHDAYHGGCIICLAAPLRTWQRYEHTLPPASGVQRLFIDAQGRAREPGKRSLGTLSGAVTVIGNASLPEAHLCEGVADALALASRLSGVAISCLGTSGMRAEHLFDALRQKRCVYIWHDNDMAGHRAGATLLKSLHWRGIAAALRRTSEGKDPAASAEKDGFPPLSPDHFAERVSIMRSDGQLPQHEAERLASIHSTSPLETSR